MNAEHEHLASAYVDGELTADERRIAEADPAVMAEVAEFHALREQLADVPPPTVTAREAALSAAMDVFHTQYGEAPTTRTATAATVAARVSDKVSHAADNVVSFWRRPAAMRLLGAAAAVLGIGLLGVVVVTGLRSADDDDMAFDTAAEEPAAEPAEERAESALVETVTDDQLDDAAVGGGADADVQFSEEMSAEATATVPAMEAADEAAAEPAEGSTDEPAGEVADAPIEPVLFFGFEQDGEPLPITSPAELTAAGRYLVELEQRDPAALTPTPNTACGAALATAAAIVDEAPVDVVIVVDDLIGEVIAYDADCAVVLAGVYEP